MLDDLANDPIFVRVRAARPDAPATLERAVLASLAPSRWPIVVGGIVAIAALICIVLFALRGGERPARVAIAPDAPVAPAVPPTDAPPPPGWNDLSSLWATIERDHRAAIEACGKGNVVIRVVRERDGSARVSHPPGVSRHTPSQLERCRAQAVAAIELPSMPPALAEIRFVLAVPAVAQPAHDWSDPLATIDEARCTTPIVVDRTHRHNPRARPACAVPPLPPMLLSITVKP